MRNKANISGISFRVITRLLSELEGRQFLAGQLTAACRDDEALRNLGESISTPTSQHCIAVYLTRIGSLDEAEARLERLIVEAPALIQAASRLTLATLNVKRGNIGRASIEYASARRLAEDPFTAVQAAQGQAILDSFRKRPFEALAELDRSFLLFKSIPPGHPLRLNFLNSVAVELITIGRPEEARPLIEELTASPLATVYPEWIATAKDLPPKPSRSSVSTQCSVQLESARIIAFPGRVVESIERRRAKAIIAIGESQSPLLLEVVGKMQEATEQRIQTCSDVLDAEEPNVKLAAWSCKAPSGVANSVLNYAQKITDKWKKVTLHRLARKEQG